MREVPGAENGVGEKPEARVSLALRDLFHDPVTEEKGLPMRLNREAYIKGDREVRNFLIMAFFCPINKHDYLIRMNGG